MSSLMPFQKWTGPCNQPTQQPPMDARFKGRKGLLAPLALTFALGAGLFTQEGCVSWSEHQRITGELRSQLSETQGQVITERRRNEQVKTQVQGLANITDSIQSGVAGLQNHLATLRSAMNALVSSAAMLGTESSPTPAAVIPALTPVGAVAPVITPLPASAGTATATN